MEKEDLEMIERKIGYQFANADLLRQAFVRRSYSQENGGEDNEILEFIGDSALDFIIVKLLAEKYGSFVRDYEDYDPEDDFNEFLCQYQEGKLTAFRKKLVEKKMLSQKIDQLSFADFLIMGKSDIKRNVNEEASVKEDLFEAIIGAVALDSAWNIDDIQSVVEIMLDPDGILSNGAEMNYVESIQEWTQKKYGDNPRYEFEEVSQWKVQYCAPQHNLPAGMFSYPVKHDSWGLVTLATLHKTGISTQNRADCNFCCILTLGDYDIPFRGFGKSKNEARKEACKLAYDYLEWKDMLFSIQDEINFPNKEEAINQLEILARRGYFSIPNYIFEQRYDRNGNPIWKCKCCIEEVEDFFWSEASSKKVAKKNAAFKMLEYVLD